MVNKQQNRVDLVDFHAHILPGADHGSDSVKTTLFQLDSAMSHGVTRVIATPHFYPNSHTVDSFLCRRNSAYEILRSHLTEDLPQILLGAEVLICEGIERLPDLDKLFIEGTNSLLLELPFSSLRDEHFRSVRELLACGVDLIIAHADRYNDSDIESMLELGARLQLNASSVSTVFARKCIFDWLDRERVVALGSDIHSTDKKAYSDFVRAISKIGDRVEFIKNESDKIWSSAFEKRK